MWDLIVSIPDRCLSFYFASLCWTQADVLIYTEYPIPQNRIMGCHGNGTLLHSPEHIFLQDNIFSHLDRPSEQFGTHENLSWEWDAG